MPNSIGPGRHSVVNPDSSTVHAFYFHDYMTDRLDPLSEIFEPETPSRTLCGIRMPGWVLLDRYLNYGAKTSPHLREKMHDCERCSEITSKPDTVRKALIAKLRPGRFTNVSGKMAAIVGFLLGERFTNPAITELVVTSDGMVLAQREDDVGANDMIGSESDLDRNLLALIEAAGLTDDEVAAFGRLQRERIVRFSSKGRASSARGAATPPNQAEEQQLPHLEQFVDVFDISNTCDDASHDVGVHRHGSARFVRWPENRPAASTETGDTKWATLKTDGTFAEHTEMFDLAALQQAVGGLIEVIDLSMPGEPTMFINEEGKLADRPQINAGATRLAAGLIMPGDFIAGDVAFTGGPDDNGDSLPLAPEALSAIRLALGLDRLGRPELN